jgi:protease-4
LESFKKSGNSSWRMPIRIQKEYYLNSVASPIYINPVGEMDFKGLSTEIMFFKDFQEKSGLKWKSFATEVQCCRAFFRK